MPSGITELSCSKSPMLIGRHLSASLTMAGSGESAGRHCRSTSASSSGSMELFATRDLSLLGAVHLLRQTLLVQLNGLIGAPPTFPLTGSPASPPLTSIYAEGCQRA